MNRLKFTQDYANSKEGDEIKADNQLTSKLVKMGVVEIVKKEDLRFSELLERLSAAEARIEALEKGQAEKPEETKAEPKAEEKPEEPKAEEKPEEPKAEEKPEEPKAEEKPEEVKAAEKSDPSEEKNAIDDNTAEKAEEAPKKPRTRKKQ